MRRPTLLLHQELLHDSSLLNGLSFYVCICIEIFFIILLR